MTAEHIDGAREGNTRVEAARSLLDGGLSMRARFAHVALLLGAAGMATAVASLWATEPALPMRTHVAFAVLVAIGLAWVVYALWALGRRHVLFGRHRVVAGWMSVGFTTMFVAGSLVVGVAGGEPAGYLSAGVGGLLLAIALAMLARARRLVARLTVRREELEVALRTGR
jgi:hypothetical protein